MARPLYEIADEIRADWVRPYFGAIPYIDALSVMNRVEDGYYLDSGESIINYFPANANTWRGEVARRIKAELKGIVKQ